MSTSITFFEIASLAASVLAWPYIRKNVYLRLFPVLLLVVVSVEAFLTFDKEAIYFNAIVYNIQIPLQHLLYIFILYLALKRKMFRRSLAIAASTFLVIAVLSGLFLTEQNKINTLSYSVGTIVIIVGILVKLYELLENPTNFNFLQDPLFYLLFAYLLFSVATLPYFVMGNWLYYTLKRNDIMAVLINVMSIFNYILYSTYTLVFLWVIRKKAYC